MRAARRLHERLGKQNQLNNRRLPYSATKSSSASKKRAMKPSINLPSRRANCFTMIIRQKCFRTQIETETRKAICLSRNIRPSKRVSKLRDMDDTAASNRVCDGPSRFFAVARSVLKIDFTCIRQRFSTRPGVLNSQKPNPPLN